MQNDRRNDQCFTDLKNIIEEKKKDSNVYYVRNNGNWGDRLIHEGAAQFFRKNGIEVKDIKNKGFESRMNDADFLKSVKNDILICGGGGNWCPYWSGIRKKSAVAVEYFREVIIMPTTFDLPKLDAENVTYFARDAFESMRKVPDSTFCHDMALYYEIPHKIREPQVDIGYFFRTDKEKNKSSNIPDFNIDLSLLGTHDKGIAPFFEILSNFQLVKTDRLHVCIAAALMGRQVHLYPGSYFKSRAIYESSLKGNFPNVEIKEWSEN